MSRPCRTGGLPARGAGRPGRRRRQVGEGEAGRRRPGKARRQRQRQQQQRREHFHDTTRHDIASRVPRCSHQPQAAPPPPAHPAALQWAPGCVHKWCCWGSSRLLYPHRTRLQRQQEQRVWAPAGPAASSAATLRWPCHHPLPPTPAPSTEVRRERQAGRHACRQAGRHIRAAPDLQARPPRNPPAQCERVN